MAVCTDSFAPTHSMTTSAFGDAGGRSAHVRGAGIDRHLQARFHRIDDDHVGAPGGAQGLHRQDADHAAAHHDRRYRRAAPA